MSIQVKRGTTAKIAASSDTLKDGQLLYNTDKNYLTVGGGALGNKLNKAPISCRELKIYSGDTSSTTGSSNTLKAQIGYDYSGNIWSITSAYQQFKFNDNLYMMPNAGGTLALASDIPTVTPMYLHCTSFADAPISTGYGGIVSGTIYTISSSSTSITTSTFYSAVGDKLWFNGYVRVDTSDAGYDYCTFLAGIFQY